MKNDLCNHKQEINFARFSACILSLSFAPATLSINLNKYHVMRNSYLARFACASLQFYSLFHCVQCAFAFKFDFAAAAALVYYLVKAIFPTKLAEMPKDTPIPVQLLMCVCWCWSPATARTHQKQSRRQSLSHTHTRTHTQTPCKFFFFVVLRYFCRRHPPRCCCLASKRKRYREISYCEYWMEKCVNSCSFVYFNRTLAHFHTHTCDALFSNGTFNTFFGSYLSFGLLL